MRRVSNSVMRAQAAQSARLAAENEAGVCLVERPCMRCDALFESEGPHHRMCTGCRNSASSGGWMGDPQTVTS